VFGDSYVLLSLELTLKYIGYCGAMVMERLEIVINYDIGFRYNNYMNSLSGPLLLVYRNQAGQVTI
jgi:hypothetical protein